MPEILSVKKYFPPEGALLLVEKVAATDRIYDFICNDVLSETCDNPTTKCMERLKHLPAAEPITGSVDGNSFGCRALHAAFALTNSDHCAHVALDPMEDTFGKIKCQQSKGEHPRDLFTDVEWEFYVEEMVKFGIDPEIGILI